MSASDPVTLTLAEYENLRIDAQVQANNAHALGDALAKLKAAAQALVDNREETDPDELQGWITDLEEAIPCDDCLQAPCVCP